MRTPTSNAAAHETNDDDATDPIMRSRVLSLAHKCLSPGQTTRLSSSAALASTTNASIASAIGVANESAKSSSSSSKDDDAKSSKMPKLTYYSAWFCPFAHRATLALSRHLSFVQYEWVESLGWEKRAKTKEEIRTKHENWYHYKSPDCSARTHWGWYRRLKMRKET